METLTKNELSFISSAFDSVFANPFAAEKRNPACPEGFSPDQLNERLLGIIKRLEESGLELIQDFPAQEKGIAEKLFISSSYLRFAGKLYSKAAEAFKAESPLKIEFGAEALLSLEKHGFERKNANRLFSAFFQIQRARLSVEDSIWGIGQSAEDFRKQLWDSVFSSNFENYINFFAESPEHFPSLIISQPGCLRNRAAKSSAMSSFIGFNEKKQSFKTDFQKLYAFADISGCREDEAESLIFGRAKGAFFWADSAAKGVLDKPVSGGIAFIEGLENLSPRLSEKLRIALDKRFYCPAGDTKQNTLETRIFAGMQEGSEISAGLKNCFAKIIRLPSLKRRIDDSSDNIAIIVSNILREFLAVRSDEISEKLTEQIIKSARSRQNWPMNEMELTSLVKSFIISGRDEQFCDCRPDLNKELLSSRPTASELLSDYCKMLYEEYGSYEKVARTADLDRRTAKKYIEMDETPANDSS
ncbi:Transcriptional regulatory protein ZraR [Sedimentisphaera cyanobacteriorum]|uniref:Transcriptional regulatory protein ZraR n=1 Tax=Sedimentisphaera cyanobacteriorum TaxID=1940790 RepID=A0A1Q2HQ68_9BACT|nr:sigma 54-interacting transcriptional regulator [Sedimentisphaera cyanobacteriorum]AQQ09597.1 Transcriptional regulatory protein ZraR [Sedimentisphaera cyanobacteriorum]